MAHEHSRLCLREGGLELGAVFGQGVGSDDWWNGFRGRGQGGRGPALPRQNTSTYFQKARMSALPVALSPLGITITASSVNIKLASSLRPASLCSTNCVITSMLL